MKFFTPELYAFTQRGDIPYKVRESRWTAASKLYSEHLKNIKHQLSKQILYICEHILHDGIIMAIEQPSPENLSLEIDSSGCPWGPRGRCVLSFRGVRTIKGLRDCVGAAWLYEEAHLDADARFSFQVLVALRTPVGHVAELCVVADDVELRAMDTAPTPVVGVDIPFLWKGGIYVWTNIDEFGAQEGWYYIKDGIQQPKSPPADALERMRVFAREIGAAVAGQYHAGGEHGERSDP